MTDFWIENGTKSELAKIVVAPEDFTMKQDVSDMVNERVLRKGKAFFTYAEFETLQKQNHIPEGYRLMTIEEATKLIEEFTNGKTSQKLVEALHLNYDGYIYPRMEDYNEDPTELSDAIENRLLEGRYWVENPHYGSPCALWVHRYKRPMLQTFCPASGAKVRLVHSS